ncbi:unnamed protein product [Moneuplotes crassus]|uniref:Uncharacterized protein n=1 Tax=Euplotes crassus TaxID=5936 RepID=A0AAD1XDI1_EUPCR|nr:unnamed protein product [Moneuplotes crassus]
MSLFTKICCCVRKPLLPKEGAHMIFGKTKEIESKKRCKYGNPYQKCTSHAREALRDNYFNFKAEKENRKAPKQPKKSLNLFALMKEQHSDEDSKSEEDNQEEEKVPTGSRDRSEKNCSIDFRDIFDRHSGAPAEDAPKFTIEKCKVYLNGPIEMCLESPLRFPFDEIEDYDKVTVTKISCGWYHLVVLLSNGVILVGGNNDHGQLGLQRRLHPEIKDELVFHEEINEKYEVLDIGCGTSHTVLLVRKRENKFSECEILTCGYHGCLGIDLINKDRDEFKEVLIPGLTNFDKIQFLICKFDSNVIIDSDNNIYYWGDELDTFRTRVPGKRNWFRKRIVDLSFGFRHALFLLEDGSIWKIDSEGINKIEDKILEKIKILKVEAGSRHSLFLDSEGRVYGIGITKLENHNTETKKRLTECEDLTDITDDSNCVDVFAGDGNSCAIDSDGIPYRWDGVTGKIEIIENLGGKYILQIYLANQNIVAVYSTETD